VQSFLGRWRLRIVLQMGSWEFSLGNSYNRMKLILQMGSWEFSLGNSYNRMKLKDRNKN
jgi:hypothetical protein